jgi:EmrB/QacA subfamily drug resistance transporter
VNEQVKERGTNLNLVLLAAGLSQICVTLDYWSLSVALPRMSRDLHVSTTDLQWAISAYIISFAAALIAAGRLADILGRKKLLVAGAALFGAASFVCGISNSVEVLVIARIVQGLGAAPLFPASMAVLVDAFPAERQAKAIGLIVGIAGIGAALGPFVGGLLTETLSWRYIFFLNVPVAIAAIVLVISVVRESRDETVPRHVDIPGLIAVSGGVIALTLGIDRGPAWGWTSPRLIAIFLVSAVLLVGFVVLEHRVKAPLVPPALLANRPLMVMSASGLAGNFNFALAIFCVTLFLQQVHGVSVMVAGVLFLPLSVAAAVGGPLSGKLSTKYSLRGLMGAGLVISAAGFAVFSLGTGWAFYFVGASLLGIGCGLAYAATNSGTLAEVPPQQSGAASGFVTTALLIGAALATTLAAMLIEQLQHGHGAHAEGIAIEGVLRVGAVVAVLGAAALPFAKSRATAPAAEPASATT